MGKGFGDTIKRLLAGIGIFAGVVLIMCLTAKIMMNLEEAEPVSTAAEQAVPATEKEEPEPAEKERSAAAEPVTEPVKEPMEEPVTEPVKEPIEEPITEPIEEPVTETIEEPVTEPIEEPIAEPAADIAEKPEVTPVSAVYDIPSIDIDRTKKVVAINAAHQKEADLSPEPVGPGATDTKARSGWDSIGISTGMSENELTLIIAKKVKKILEERGYQVLMLRDENTPSISDAMRAQTANAYADIAVHIHANWDDNYDITGIMAFYPSEDNPYAADYSEPCLELSKAILKGLKASTGAKNWGPIDLDTQSTLNWTKIPASHVEVGYMSNAKEDALMGTEEYRDKIAVGIADGIDLYFSER